MQHSTLLALLALALLAPSAAAQVPDLASKPGCPEDPTRCTYARGSVSVGPLLVTVEARMDEGSAEEEVEASATPGGDGSLTFQLLANQSAEGTTLNVTIRVNETEHIFWHDPTTRAFEYTPTAGTPRTEAFRFRLADDAPAGSIALPFTIAVGNETATAALALRVVEEAGESETPAAPLLALLGVAASAALLRRR